MLYYVANVIRILGNRAYQIFGAWHVSCEVGRCRGCRSVQKPHVRQSMWSAQLLLSIVSKGRSPLYSHSAFPSERLAAPMVGAVHTTPHGCCWQQLVWLEIQRLIHRRCVLNLCQFCCPTLKPCWASCLTVYSCAARFISQWVYKPIASFLMSEISCRCS